MDRKEKLSTPYKVKDENPNPILDMDSKDGTVKMVWNTYNYLDTDGDILLDGCSSKSISERGPEAKTAAIKHALFHDIKRIPGKVVYLAEEYYDFNEKRHKGIVAVSKLELNTEDGRDTFLKYESGIYDNHSIGFRYIQMDYVEPGTDQWKELEDTIINPELLAESAARFGGVWPVKEIKLYEGSTVSFGANDLTPVLGVKGIITQDMKQQLLNDQFKRQELLTNALKKGLFTDDTMLDFEIQYKQCQQIIYELSKHEPPKSTLQSREKHSDSSGRFDILTINQTLNYNHEN